MNRGALSLQPNRWEQEEEKRTALYRMLIKARDYAESSQLFLEADMIHEFSRRFSVSPPVDQMIPKNKNAA